MFARRIRRLERAADRIANGRFDEPVVDTGGGELGALAAAFERMRVRLAQLDDARREFVANASHELRTPLFSLAGFLELLDDEELDEPTRREFLGLDARAGRPPDEARLRPARPLAARLGPADASTREPVDLGGAGGRPGRGVRAAGGLERPPRSRWRDPASAVLARGRRAARAPARPDPGRERARCTRRRGRRSRCGRSSGTGTPCSRSRTRAAGSARTQREQLFERFFRLDGTRASGSGLGLAIARQLAELMDGSIELESRPGQNRVLARAARAPSGAARAVFTRKGPFRGGVATVRRPCAPRLLSPSPSPAPCSAVSPRSGSAS